VESAAQRALPVVVQVGRTVDVLSDRSSQPDAFLGLARAFPKTSFIAGHSGFELWKSFTVNQNVPRNVYFDVSSWQEAAARDADGTRADLATLLKKSPRRVCYGTDSPFYSYNLMVSESNWLRFVSDAADPETAAIMLCNPIFSAVF